MIRQNAYDVVLLDLSLPDIHGLDVLQQVGVEFPNLPVLVLSIHPENQFAIRALKAGAYGYITKDTDPEDLLTAIRTAAKGKKYISPQLACSLVAYISGESPLLPHESLSDREYQVMRLMAVGKTIREISNVLQLSPNTISTYRRRLLQKMGLRNNAELVRYAARHNLLE